MYCYQRSPLSGLPTTSEENNSMAFHLLRNESVEEGVRRIVGEQIASAIAEVEDTRLDPHATVHQVRKRCKKIRGVIRLVRQPACEHTYQFENEWFREAARKLSFVRDAEAMREAYDKLLDTFAEPVLANMAW
jgi:hypothetical protein